MNITERMNHFNIPAVSITCFADGKIDRSKHFGTLEKGTNKIADDNSIFHACSISKMITAICVLKLAQYSTLDLYKDVNEYLTAWKIPDNEFTQRSKITLANLLAHQAGLRDYNDTFNPYKSGDNTPSLVTILDKAVNIQYEPETDCEYSDAGYAIISQVLLDALGETLSQAANRIIIKPLGLTRTFFMEPNKNDYDGISFNDCAVGHDRHGNVVKEIRAVYPNVEGAGLWTTTRELAALIIDLLQSYHNNNGLVLNQEMARLMLTPYGCTDDVGLGVFLVKDKDGKPFFVSQGWGVGMQCKLRVNHEAQNGIIVMTNSDPGIDQDESLIGEVIRYARLQKL